MKRGMYFASGPGETAARTSLDYLLVASRLVSDAVLAYHTALEAHGYAQSLFERLFFLTTAKVKPLKFRGRNFVPVVPPTTLRRKKKSFIFCTEVERRGLPSRVTTLEETLVDVLDRPDLAGGLEEAWRSLCAVRQRWRPRSVLFLEQRREALSVSEEALTRLRRMRPRQSHYFDRQLGGRIAPAWNLIVPAPILTREWEAVA